MDAVDDDEPLAPLPVLQDLSGSSSKQQLRATASLCGQALQLLSMDGACVVVMGTAGNRELVHATDETVANLDELQFTLGEGPGIDAYRVRSHVLVDDLENEIAFARWPGFAHEATQTGARAAFAFPLQFGVLPVPFGMVEFYRRLPGGLTETELAAALRIVDGLVRAVLDDLTGGGQLDPNPSQPEPMFGRSEVAQATGMISVQLGVPIPQALARLRASAFIERRTVADVAADVIARRRIFTASD